MEMVNNAAIEDRIDEVDDENEQTREEHDDDANAYDSEDADYKDDRRYRRK